MLFFIKHLSFKRFCNLVSQQFLGCCIRGTLNPVYRGDPELERTLRLLRRFQLTGYFPDNDIIGIANDRARNIRDYVVFDPNAMNTRIIKPKIIVAQFEFKPMIFQMLQAIGQYSSSANDDPHLYLRQFLEVASNFKIPDISNDAFRQGAGEALFDAWESFKDLFKQYPHHGISICIKLQTFYNGLVPSSRNMLDASSDGALLSQSYEEGYKLIERITTNTYQWMVSRVAPTPSQKKPDGVHVVIETTTLAAQMAQINQMMMNMMTSPVMAATELVKVVTDTSKVACVYCGGSHLFED
ncbi:hypothetical protein KIW84_071373 [Lathyrus oleraceus]|uniref:Uncharacterized protein n=1 Tax=Pisum sativum TaxID=3888 RepID=A0A9D4VK17_PEA|nr:hypothetical protein KIW84_071373 [Pisum sativum]